MSVLSLVNEEQFVVVVVVIIIIIIITHIIIVVVVVVVITHIIIVVVVIIIVIIVITTTFILLVLESIMTAMTPIGTILHNRTGGAPLDPNTLPADWRAHGASGDRILNTCASRTCGHTEVCVPRTPTPGQHDCLAVPARCQDPAINNTVLQLLSGSLQDDVANVTCDASFVASPRHVSTQIQCQVTGRWTTWSGQCLQAEFHPTGQAATDFKERVPWTITVGSRVCVEATYYGSDRIIWDYHNAQGGWPGPKDLGRVQFVSGEQLKIEFYMESPVLMVMQLTRTALDLHHYMGLNRDANSDKIYKTLCSDKTLPEFLRYYTAGSVLVRLLNQGIEILQRRKDYLAAVTLIRELLSQDVYNLDLHGFWWERLALNLDVHLKQHGQALQAIQDGLADSAVRTGHRLALYLRAESICNKSKSPYKKRLKEFNHEPLKELPKTFVEGRVLADAVAGRIHQFMTDSSQTDDDAGDVTLCNVEQVVLDHYNVSGYPQGVHAEGSILSTLFILYFWDVLFMDVADVFHSPYQTHPLDFNTDAFYQHRKECIDARLAEIEKSSEEELQKMMAETWETHYSVLCAGVNWERFASIDQIKGLISCVGGRVLAGILGRYAVQPRHTRGGFPDLTLWNTDTKQLKICEVKGPGDRLSHKQMLWLDHLLKLGVDAEVCHVKAVGAKKLKRSSSSVSS
nr:hypothetical protein BaRGS_002065 [Batillaria attramentaria]